MDLEKLKTEETLIEKYIKQFYDKSNPESEPILDGIVNEENYLKSKFRIAWILKEPYDEDDAKGGGWSLTKEILNQDNLYPKVVGRSPTWQPMVYVTYSLLNGFIPYNDGMDYISDNPNMAQCLTEIAFLNINKMPGYHRSKDSELPEKYNYWKPILHWQLHTYKPQILIFGNTLQYFYDDLFTEHDKKKEAANIEYVLKGKQLFINAYHPAQSTITRDLYVQSIVDVVKKNTKYIV